jgi:hypothetical protein
MAIIAVLLYSRLADCPQYGPQNHEPDPDARLLRRDRWYYHPIPFHLPRHPGFDDPYDRRRHNGVGAAKRVSAVRWNIAGGIVIAWLLTLPASGALAAIAHNATRIIG